MSQWEHTASEFQKSLGIPSNYSSVFLPFPRHALGKNISYSLTSVSQLQMTSHTGSWRLLKLLFSSRDKASSLSGSVETFVLLQLLFSIWGYWNTPSPWNSSVMASLTFIILSWSFSSLSDTLHQAIFQALFVLQMLGLHTASFRLSFLIVNSHSSGTHSSLWFHRSISILIFSKAVLK